MEKVLAQTKRKFTATIVLVVAVVVGSTWGMLQYYNHTEIGAPAQLSEIHSSADNNAEFEKYLAQQSEYEAHFITLASSIKNQESKRVTRAVAISSVLAVVIGVIAAFFVSKRLIRPVREAYESQERFIQDAAHELRNPLAAMTATLQQTKQQSPLITTIKRQTKRLIHINEDLLFLERRNKKNPTMVNLSELLEDVLEELQPIASRRKIVLELSTGNGIMKKMVASDYVRMVKNVIDNAIKYSHTKSTVTITQKVVKNSILITVRDNGIGIPEKDMNSIGGRFFRASNTGTRDGTGLGLAIVQKILDEYDSDKKIISNADGTVVTLGLPL